MNTPHGNIGKRHSEEHIKKIRESIRRWHEKKGYVPAWNKGKKTSEETKEKQRQAKLKNPVRYWKGKKRPDISILISAINKGRSAPKGKDNPCWRGGTPGWYRKQARSKMEEKYNRKFSLNEVVHHIDGNWKNNEINNLVVLTRASHCILHKPRKLKGGSNKCKQKK